MHGSIDRLAVGVMGAILGAVAGSIVLTALGAATGAVTALLLGLGVPECSLFGVIFGGLVGAAGGAIGGWAGGTTVSPPGRSALVAVIIVCAGASILLGGWVSARERAFLLTCAVIGTLASWSVAATLARRMIRCPAAGDNPEAKPPSSIDDLGS
jgi:hypothetical protein